jgi:hypothetical protein
MGGTEHTALDGRVHAAIVRGVIETGRAPGAAEIAAAVESGAAEIEASLRRLEANHGLVLHPGKLEVWVVHPFSLVPTLTWVENARGGWWCPCIWCALGAVELVGGKASIHTRLGGEGLAVVIDVDGPRISPGGLVAHFPVPAAQAWENVHRFCGSTLVFGAAAEVDAWCGRHGCARGDVVELPRVQRLARAWYGRHAAADWRKWTIAEARKIFSDVGLGGRIWELPEVQGRY